MVGIDEIAGAEPLASIEQILNVGACARFNIVNALTDAGEPTAAAEQIGHHDCVACGREIVGHALHLFTEAAGFVDEEQRRSLAAV